jgi:hypothetical protein
MVGVSCSCMTSSTLNGSTHDGASSIYDGTSSICDGASNTYGGTSIIRKTQKVRFQTDLMIEGNNKKMSDVPHGRYIVPDHVFNILFLRGLGVGKSQIINWVSRASPFSEYLLMPDRLYMGIMLTIILLRVMISRVNPSEPVTRSVGWTLLIL